MPYIRKGLPAAATAADGDSPPSAAGALAGLLAFPKCACEMVSSPAAATLNSSYSTYIEVWLDALELNLPKQDAQDGRFPVLDP